ncbi:PREDICTED: uncharacterized protein LOC109225950 [Nicotiana attenuata]|uniref:uncharacterized protein LOC109225950 n=1 Tax=Nicotiana attenuata TaxID=49451 RepID=UPI00090597BE|nr:PREDICTED: uncharacterized protein LOC109225950 [Nicotiana attenuata]
MSTTGLTPDPLASATSTVDHVVPEASVMSGVVHSSYPYYLHPSDYPGMNLVSTVFDGRSFSGRRRAVVIALSAKNKLGFIDGALTIPQADSDFKRLGQGVMTCAKDLWSDLEDRFGQTNGSKLFQLQKELSAVIQGVRSNILLSLPLPSIGQAYSLVIQNEKQREIHAAPAYPGESGSFLATNQQGNGRRFNENKGQKGGFDPRKNAKICTYCKKPGILLIDAIRFMV